MSEVTDHTPLAQLSRLRAENEELKRENDYLRPLFSNPEDWENQLKQAERRGEERGWKAARRATNGCVISMDYSEGGGPRFVAISDWRASEEYKEEE